ncbi:hypothetical protein ACFLZW_06020 [Chloroflexota bacterium]
MEFPNKELPSRGLPVSGNLGLAYWLSVAIAVIMIAVSLAGLLYQQEIYPAEELLLAFVPNDVVNLVIGAPILLISIWLVRRGNLVGLLFWPGALLYVLYTYLVYVIGMPLNAVYLLYLALVTLSAYTMVGVITSIDGKVVKRQLSGAVPERAAAGVLAGLGSLFFLRVIAVIVETLSKQTAVTSTELALLATDFMITPAWIIGGMLLWRRKELGYVTGVGLLFQSSMLFIGLILIMLIQPLLTGAPFMPVDIVVVFIMGLVCFIPFGLFLRGALYQRSSPEA